MKFLKNLFFVFALMAVPFMVSAKEIRVGENQDKKTLNDAIEFAQDNDVVILDQDFDISEEGLIIDKDIVLDLNGNEIKVASSYNKNIYVNKGAKLTLKDSGTNGEIVTIGATDQTGFANIDVAGEFVMESGKITATNTSLGGDNLIGVALKGQSNDDSVKVVINGGTISSYHSSIVATNYHVSNVEVEINGGKISSSSAGAINILNGSSAYRQQILNINGGDLSGSNYTVSASNSKYYSADAMTDVTITGGNFVCNAADCNIFELKYYDNGFKLATERNIVDEQYNLNITAGSYSKDISKLAAVGYEVFENDGKYIVDLSNVEMDEVVIPEKVEKPYIKGDINTSDILLDTIKKNEALLSAYLQNPQAKAVINVKEVEADGIDEKVKNDIAATLENGVIATYLDIEVILELATNKSVISELSDKISLTIALPKDLKNTDKTVERVYYIIREHNGVVEKLEANLNEDGTLSFESDKFSTYAVAYEDKEIKETITNPQTGDAIALYGSIALISAGVMIVAIKKLKEN